MRIQGSTFIVTGGSSGLGGATARLLHARGANVVVADVNEALGEGLARELGDRAAYCRTDVSSEADAKACVALALARFGSLQGLVNCAGVGVSERLLGRDGPHRMESFERALRVNLLGSFNMIRVAAEVMSTGQPSTGGERGVIVNTASVAAFDGQIGQAAYAASKAGIVGMTLPLARELARFGVRVMTIAPGLFQTPMMAGLPEDVQAALGQSVPFPPRLGRPEEYAQLVTDIVANEMLNGETIRLDGALRLAPR